MSSLDAGYSTDTTTTLTRARAGFWRRFAAAFIDGILLGVISTILRLILGNLGAGLVEVPPVPAHDWLVLVLWAAAGPAAAALTFRWE